MRHRRPAHLLPDLRVAGIVALRRGMPAGQLRQRLAPGARPELRCARRKSGFTAGDLFPGGRAHVRGVDLEEMPAAQEQVERLPAAAAVLVGRRREGAFEVRAEPGEGRGGRSRGVAKARVPDRVIVDQDLGPGLEEGARPDAFPNGALDPGAGDPPQVGLPLGQQPGHRAHPGDRRLETPRRRGGREVAEEEGHDAKHRLPGVEAGVPAMEVRGRVLPRQDVESPVKERPVQRFGLGERLGREGADAPPERRPLGGGVVHPARRVVGQPVVMVVDADEGRADRVLAVVGGEEIVEHGRQRRGARHGCLALEREVDPAALSEGPLHRVDHFLHPRAVLEVALVAAPAAEDLVDEVLDEVGVE